jgi:hypothetical protein
MQCTKTGAGYGDLSRGCRLNLRLRGLQTRDGCWCRRGEDWRSWMSQDVCGLANSACAEDGASSPGGRFIAMSKCAGRRNQTGIAVERADGRGFHWLTKPRGRTGSSGTPVLSPDGARIAYTLSRAVRPSYFDHTEIRMVSLAGERLGNLESFKQDHDEVSRLVTRCNANRLRSRYSSRAYRRGRLALRRRCQGAGTRALSLHRPRRAELAAAYLAGGSSVATSPFDAGWRCPTSCRLISWTRNRSKMRDARHLTRQR